MESQMQKDSTSSVESLSFEGSYTRLENVIERLEQGDLPLEEAVALYEEGMSLARHCGRQLDAAELRVTKLLTETDEAEAATAS